MDVLVTALDEPALLLRNDTPSDGHWVKVRLVGKRSNRDGVGARLRLKAGELAQIRERKGGGLYLSSSDPRLHVGLGEADRVDVLEIRWPSGTRDVLRDVAADRTVTIEEGSSPRTR